MLAEFNTTDDGCAAGSPRITIHLVSAKVQSGARVSTYSAALALINSKPPAEQVVSSVSFDVDAGYAFADKEQTVEVRKFVVNNLSFPTVFEPPTTPPGTAKPNPSRLCRAQQQAKPAGFKTMYGTNANRSNAFGKCVSRMAKAISAGTVSQVQQQTTSSLKAKKAHWRKK